MASCFSDLSPIENVWSELQAEVAPFGDEARDLEELKTRIRKFFREYSAEKCLKLVRSLPKRLQLMKEADFNTIKN